MKNYNELLRHASRLEKMSNWRYRLMRALGFYRVNL